MLSSFYDVYWDSSSLNRRLAFGLSMIAEQQRKAVHRQLVDLLWIACNAQLMATTNDEETGEHETYTGFFHRSLSPRSFDRLRTEHSEYFYKPKRGPSTSKSNITITRPIKTFESVSKLVQLLSHGPNPQGAEKQHAEEMESPPLSKKFDEHRSSSHYSSFLSMDGGDLSSTNSSSVFSSRSNSSISTVAEQETQVIVIDEPLSQFNETGNWLSRRRGMSDKERRMSDLHLSSD